MRFKLLIQKQWSEAETWDLSQPAPWGLPDHPRSWVFTANTTHALSVHRGTTGARNVTCWAAPTFPWWLVPLVITKTYVAALPKGPLAPGLWGYSGQCRKGRWGSESRGSQTFVLGVQLISTFPHPSLRLSQHNCPTLSKWRHKANTQKPQRFAITSQRSATADLAAKHCNPIGCSAILAETSNHKKDIHSNQKQPTLPHCC